MEKLIAVDIDGTLLTDDKKISDKNKEVLKKIREAGHKLVIASGRDYSGTTFLAEELDFQKYGGFLSNFNGGRITDFKSRKIIANHTLSLDFMREFLDFIRDLDIDIMIYYDGKICTNSMATYWLKETADQTNQEIVLRENLIDDIDFEPNNILLSQNPNRIEEPSRIIYEKYKDITHQVRSTPWYYEIMPKGVSKGKSLYEIADIYSIPYENIIAFGNEMNDKSMIEMAGVGVAMGNAVEGIKEISDFITLTNEEDGIAYHLEKFVL